MSGASEKYDYVFKFIIIGDTGTGKSCALHQFVEGKCESPSRFSSCSTLELAASSERHPLGREPEACVLWHTMEWLGRRPLFHVVQRGAG